MTLQSEKIVKDFEKLDNVNKKQVLNQIAKDNSIHKKSDAVFGTHIREAISIIKSFYSRKE